MHQVFFMYRGTSRALRVGEFELACIWVAMHEFLPNFQH